MKAIISSTSNAATQVCPMDRMVGTFKAGIQVVLTGASTWSLQLTQDDPFAAYPTSFAASATWIDYVTGITATAGIFLEAPCTALRLNPTSYTSGGVVVTVDQGGPVK